jgi:5-formyltetrahydrofolate cyclo-ligase
MGQQGKKEMRREIKLVLANLDKRWQAAAYSEVCRRVVTVIEAEQEEPITDVLAWIPNFAGEVDMAEVIAAMLRNRRVYLPRVEDDGVMSFLQVGEDWASGLEQGARNVIQPKAGSGPELRDVEYGRLAVLVPGLAFDATGARLGRGGGYYDRFLAQHAETNALTIGVCWSVQIVPQVPTDAHDVKVGWLCHERDALKVA